MELTIPTDEQKAHVEKMLEHIISPKDVITEDNLKEFGEKTSDDFLTYLKEELLSKKCVAFDKGFITYDWDINNPEELTIHSFYRSKDSTVDILEIWEDYKNMAMAIGVKKILGFAINKKLRDLYESKYGFTILDYNRSEKRYYMELEI